MKRFGLLPAWAFLGLFFVLPLLALVPETVRSGGEAFGQVIADHLFLSAFRNTVVLGLFSGCLSTIVGTAIAIELTRQPESRRQWLMMLLGIPLAFSGLVIAYGFILAYGRAGFVTQLIVMLGGDPAQGGRWLYSAVGLALAYAYYLIPRVALSLYPVFANLDERPWLAARTLGASRTRAFFDTVIPEVAPSIIANACLAAALAMGTYGTALALVGTQLNILPLLLFAKINDSNADLAAASAISLILLALCVFVLGVGNVFTSRREYAAIPKN
ncbi:ABC transporter permease subunit (plasmid) [Mycetohabitans endofungorum]|uniref:ABC transporter permease n=1 Tax=Mycetohabitans endofungorum TaxID=417203 RepID=UPI002B060064|nr:ABC transporter permease subunit [Mycetohabitans endofungorum]